MTPSRISRAVGRTSSGDRAIGVDEPRGLHMHRLPVLPLDPAGAPQQQHADDQRQRQQIAHQPAQHGAQQNVQSETCQFSRGWEGRHLRRRIARSRAPPVGQGAVPSSFQTHDAQAKVLLECIEVTVAVKQAETVRDAACRNEHVDSAAHGDAERTKSA